MLRIRKHVPTRPSTEHVPLDEATDVISSVWCAPLRRRSATLILNAARRRIAACRVAAPHTLHRPKAGYTGSAQGRRGRTSNTENRSEANAGFLTVGFHNFNLRIFNLRVSNPNKLIVDVFLTRCRISMCQGLGPKKRDEISEIDRRCGRSSRARGARSLRRGTEPDRPRACWTAALAATGRRSPAHSIYPSIHPSIYLYIYISLALYIYIYICGYIYIYAYIYIYIYIERERETIIMLPLSRMSWFVMFRQVGKHPTRQRGSQPATTRRRHAARPRIGQLEVAPHQIVPCWTAKRCYAAACRTVRCDPPSTRPWVQQYNISLYIIITMIYYTISYYNILWHYSILW